MSRYTPIVWKTAVLGIIAMIAVAASGGLRSSPVQAAAPNSISLALSSATTTCTAITATATLTSPAAPLDPTMVTFTVTAGAGTMSPTSALVSGLGTSVAAGSTFTPAAGFTGTATIQASAPNLAPSAQNVSVTCPGTGTCTGTGCNCTINTTGCCQTGYVGCNCTTYSGGCGCGTYGGSCGCGYGGASYSGCGCGGYTTSVGCGGCGNNGIYGNSLYSSGYLGNSGLYGGGYGGYNGYCGNPCYASCTPPITGGCQYSGCGQACSIYGCAPICTSQNCANNCLNYTSYSTYGYGVYGNQYGSGQYGSGVPCSGPPTTINLLVPNSVVCGSQSDITAVVTDAAGYRVSDNTPVTWTTSMGQITSTNYTDGGQAVGSLVIPTRNNGIAKVTVTVAGLTRSGDVRVNCDAPVAVIAPQIPQIPQIVIQAPRTGEGPIIRPPNTGDAGLRAKVEDGCTD